MAIEAIRLLGDEIVSVTVRTKGQRARATHVAFDIPGIRAAALVQAAVETDSGEQPAPLRPTAELAEALTEGFALGGRFASAPELFDALEKDRQSLARRGQTGCKTT